jgi:hypothetical protein
MKTLLLILCLACAQGCATRETSPPPHRESASLTLRAEQTIAVSFDIVDAFLLWEYHNRESLGADVRDVAERLRREAPGAFMTARSFLRAYKSNPSPQQAAAVERQLQTLADMASKAKVTQ